jgi:hypothetical protein
VGMGLRHSLTLGIALGLASFITALVGVFLVAFIIDFLAPNFGSQKDFARAFQLVAYSSTAMWVAGILRVVPLLGILVLLASLYGIYLLYLGLPHLMKTPPEKVGVYLVVSIVVVIAVNVLIGLALSAMILAAFGLSHARAFGP